MNNRFGSERERYGEFGPISREGERSPSRRNEDDEGSRWGRGEPGSARGESRWGRSERDDWDEPRFAAQSREPRYSSDYDETYGSEWQRGTDESRFGADRGRPRPGAYGQSGYGQSSYGQGRSSQGSFGQGDESRRGWYARGQAGAYGSGTSGYQGGYGSGGYGGSMGTNYRESGWGRVGYGSSEGSSYGGEGDSSRGRGYIGRDFGGASSDWSRPSRGGFAGRGPKGYTRTDERIREDVCDRLSRDDEVDATEIEVRVQNGEVTLEGTVQTRGMKHQAEDLTDDVPGVKDVHNNLRVIKGLLNELKDKVSGNQEHNHYANTGTKETSGTTSQTSANGRA